MRPEYYNCDCTNSYIVNYNSHINAVLCCIEVSLATLLNIRQRITLSMSCTVTNHTDALRTHTRKAARAYERTRMSDQVAAEDVTNNSGK